MPALVLDACATLHLKQLGALELLTCFRARGCRLVSPNSVHGELVTMSLSQWLNETGTDRERVTRAESKAARNQADPRKLPGANDLDAIALAVRLAAPLLTHDELCGEAARRNRVLVLDVCDVAGFVVDRGWMTAATVDERLVKLSAFAYRPADWSGHLEGTLEQRPFWAKTRAWRERWAASHDT